MKGEDVQQPDLGADADDLAKYSAANGRRYLLSGILRCGLCKGGMVGRRGALRCEH